MLNAIGTDNRRRASLRALMKCSVERDYYIFIKRAWELMRKFILYYLFERSLRFIGKCSPKRETIKGRYANKASNNNKNVGNSILSDRCRS